MSDDLPPLVPCPFCGNRDGYTLAEGATYRWWRVQCSACGAGVAECRSDRRTHLGTALPAVWPSAHEAWNAAGAYAAQAVAEYQQDAERWRCLLKHASLGFEGGPGWRAVIRVPMTDSDHSTITEIVDAARGEAKP